MGSCGSIRGSNTMSLANGYVFSHAVQFIDEERGIDEKIAKAGSVFTIAQASFRSPPPWFKNHPNASCGNFRACWGVGDALPIACVQPLDLLKRHRSDKPSLIGGAVDGIVVQQRQMAIIHFTVRAQRGPRERTGFPYTRKRIFRGVAACPMTDTKGGSDSDLAHKKYCIGRFLLTCATKFL